MPDRHDLEIMHEPGGQDPAGVGIGLEIQGDVEAGGGGEGREGVGLAEAEGGRERGEPFSAGRIAHRLALIVGEARGERRRQ